jgi:hypothetical protein
MLERAAIIGESVDLRGQLPLAGLGGLLRGLGSSELIEEIVGRDLMAGFGFAVVERERHQHDDEQEQEPDHQVRHRDKVIFLLGRWSPPMRAHHAVNSGLGS